MILMVYQLDMFREYVLPKNNDMDYEIILDKSLFHINENIVLDLECVENKWILHENDQFGMVCDGKQCSDIELEDANVIYCKTSNNEKIQLIVADVEDTFRVFEKYDFLNTNYITFGKGSGNIISYEFRDLISKNHGIIRKENNEVYVEDYSSNGIFLNYAKIKGKTRLKFGDVINIFGLKIIFLENIIGICSNYGNISVDEKYLRKYFDNSLEETHTGKKKIKRKLEYFNRSPRNIPDIHEGVVEIEAPPSPKVSHKKPLFLTIGPSFTMAIPMMLGCFMSIYAAKSTGRNMGAYMYTGIITAAGSAIIGVMWAILNLKYSKQQEKEDEQLRFDSYGNYLIEIAEDLRKKYSENISSMYSIYPSASECCVYDKNSANLWNRNTTHKDFFFHRLGVGDIPFQVEINVPKEKFTLVHDTLKKQPKLLFEEYKTLKNVPVGIDINEKNIWGIVGGENLSGAYKIMNNLVAQIVTNVSYTDVKLAFVYDEKKQKDKEQFGYVKWLPHVWSEDKKTRYIAANDLEAKDVFYEISNVLRHRSESDNRKKMYKPHYVLFIQSPEILEGEIIKKYLFDPEVNYGITVFIMAPTPDMLPNECEDIIQYDQYFSGVYNTMDTTGNRKQIAFDEVSLKELNDLSKRLSSIQVNEVESNTDIPNSLEFLEMYGVKHISDLNVLDRWRKNRTFNTMKALIGKKAGDTDCYLDIHEKFHGPHGLIAGTTGSGKSETLQTYMLSLAINYSPDDIGFFVIDFKGGGMANLFSNLPHMLGQISNLSGNQVRRAMISIKSENMRRQRIFSEYGVNNINLYTRLYKNNETKIPIPHLFIIIDEFAELKREEPDFMRELISVAQVGRSLGVHLILATQKPSGTVDDNIWSNSKFRLCLRVQDKQDSNDMLHKPDAAYITQAGRCYLQVGNDEIYELFQSGWSGAVYDSSETDSMSQIATMITLTGKTALVGSHTKIKRKEEEKKRYYTSIVEIAMSLMLSNRIRKVSDLDENRMTSWIYQIIDQMNAEGLEYDKSNSNIRRLRDMLNLWPEENLTAAEIAENITIKAMLKNIQLPELKEKTQLDAIVEYLKKLADENGYNNNLKLWLPVLKRELFYEEIQGNPEEYFDGEKWSVDYKNWSIDVPIGMYDDPENQSQAPIHINISDNGHLVVCGSIVSGKSTFLQTLVYGLTRKYSPDIINIYALDFSGGMLNCFANMPHVGGVIGENDIDSIGKLFNMINSILDERKKVFGGGNYAQYVKAYGIKYPAIVIIIDNFSSFSEKTDSVYADMIFRLVREGVAYGIFLIMTSAGFGMSEIPNKIGDNIKNVVTLDMGDKFKYMEVLHISKLEVLPEADVKGRGLANINGSILEYQTALSCEAEDDYKRSTILEKLSLQMKEAWTGKIARKIPRIPEKPTMSIFNEVDEVKELNETKNIIPIGYRQYDASIFGINLLDTYCYAIAGKAKTGKTMLLKNILEQSISKNGKIIIIEKEKNEFEIISKEIGAEYVSGDKEIFDVFKNISPTFAERNKKKHSYIEAKLSSEEIYQKMNEETPIFIFIADMMEFLKAIYTPEEGVGNMKGFMETIFAKGELHNIYFFSCIKIEDTSLLATYKAYKSFIEYKSGMLLGGNSSAQRVFEFQNIPFSEAGKPMKRGLGLAASGEDGTEAEKIVIPLNGK